MSKNQLGRELLQRLVEETGCDLQVAIRFFYNSDFYTELSDCEMNASIDSLYSQFKKEYMQG